MLVCWYVGTLVSWDLGDLGGSLDFLDLGDLVRLKKQMEGRVGRG